MSVLNDTDVYKNLRSRKWLLTINNPIDKGFTHEVLKDLLLKLKVSYWCMSDETGENGTYHTHIYLYRDNAISAKRLHNLFPEHTVTMLVVLHKRIEIMFSRKVNGSTLKRVLPIIEILTKSTVKCLSKDPVQEMTLQTSMT